LTIIFVSFLSFGSVQTSFGHAFVVNSNPSQSQSIPSSPHQVNVYFSEPVDLHYSHLKVLDSSGKQVDKGDVRFLAQNDESALTVSVPSLKDGIYTVSTNVLSSTDGHVTENAFVFAIGQQALPANVTKSTQSSTLYLPEAIARFPTLLAQVMIVGAAFFTLWMWAPLSKITSLSQLTSQISNKANKSLVIYYVTASIILVSSNFAILYFQSIAINGSIIDVLGTRFGTVLIERSVISFIILGLSLFEFERFRKKGNHTFSKSENMGFLIIGIFLLITTSLIGHGASNKQLVPIIMDFVHNLTASIWIGGTFYLAFILIPVIKQSNMDWSYKLATLSLWIPRYSALIVTLLGVIIITGPFLLYILEDNLSLVISSLYGSFLILKLLFAGVMVVSGGYSSFFIYKKVTSLLRVQQTIGNKSGNSNLEEQPENERKARSIVTKFNRALLIESIFGLALLISVGLLVNTGVPASEAQNQFPSTSNTTTAQNENYLNARLLDNETKVDLSIKPFEVGNNNFLVSFSDGNGQPIDVQSVEIKYSQIEKSIGPIRANLEKQSSGKFSVNASFGIPGTWNLEVQAAPIKENTSAIVASFDNLRVKPNLDQQSFNVTEFPISNTKIQPLYPVYDKSRNYVWFGDTTIGSGRIFAYDIDGKNYVEHNITGTNIVTLLTLDSKNNLWYLDPLTKIIGSYDPSKNISRIFPFPGYVTPSGITIDSDDNIWFTSPLSSEVMRFDPKVGNVTLTLNLKDNDARPFAIMADPVSNLIWFTDEAGKLGKIDPTNNFTITEYSPSGNKTLLSPTALMIDKSTGEIYVSQHDGHRVTVFDPLSRTFTDLPLLNEEGLPFGMAFDKYGNLWVAEHTINKIAVIDTQKSKVKEIAVNNSSPFIQWLSSDSSGNIWFAEQRGNGLGMIELSSGPLAQKQAPESNNSSTPAAESSRAGLGINYQNFVAPAILIGIIFSAFMFAKNTIQLKSNISKISDR
jgi:copper transport protein